MPIVTIQIVISESDNRYSTKHIERISDLLGTLFNSDPGGTWIKLEYLDSHLYAENEMHPNSNIQPTFVEVLKRSLPDQDSLAAEAKQIAAKIAHVLSRPVESVHIIYLPPAGGRIAFGGNLLAKPKGNNGQ